MTITDINLRALFANRVTREYVAREVHRISREALALEQFATALRQGEEALADTTQVLHLSAQAEHDLSAYMDQMRSDIAETESRYDDLLDEAATLTELFGLTAEDIDRWDTEWIEGPS
jgi:hypothetical protein